MKKKLLCFILPLVLCLCLLPAIVAAEGTSAEDIVILYTNDIHTYITKDITYSKVAALKDSYENALLVDAGDHIQGTAYGSMDKGETILKLMNAAGYDLATLGNHEFDYGMDGCMQAIEWAEFPYISCNFYREENGVVGENVLDAYKIFEVNGTQIAFVGITTPKTITSSTPAYFQDDNGNYIYGIAAGEDGAELYAAVQTAVDAAADAGADYIIALGHLGDDLSCAPYCSMDVIGNTTGIDAFIDGHSHSTVPMTEPVNKDGESVVLTQTGSYFGAVGKMTISADGDITTELLTADALTDVTPDADVKSIEDAWVAEIDAKLGSKIGFTALTLDNYDADGNRLVRKQETNTGDFVADALYYLFDSMDMDVDVAIMNGGGTRNRAVTGDITYNTCKEIHSFGNVACLQTVTGQQILDALEWGAQKVGEAENGGFLQVSGLTYKVDATVASTIRFDDKGVWTGAPTGEYRVFDVMVYNKETDAWDALDLNAKYNLAGYNYTLRNLGDGFAMFDGSVNVLDYVMEDYMVLEKYVQAFEDHTIGAKNSPLLRKYKNLLLDYSAVNGSGRITIVTESQDGGRYFADVHPVGHAAKDAIDFTTARGIFVGTGADTFTPDGSITRGMFVTALWRLAGEPVVNYLMRFADVDSEAYYTEAIRWAASEKIAEGYSVEAFGPNDPITREQLASILYRYEQKNGGGFTGMWMFLLNYADRAEVSSWAYEPVCYMTMHGILGGKDDNLLDPKGTATRAEAAQIFKNYLESK